MTGESLVLKDFFEQLCDLQDGEEFEEMYKILKTLILRVSTSARDLARIFRTCDHNDSSADVLMLLLHEDEIKLKTVAARTIFLGFEEEARFEPLLELAEDQRSEVREIIVDLLTPKINRCHFNQKHLIKCLNTLIYDDDDNIRVRTQKIVAELEDERLVDLQTQLLQVEDISTRRAAIECLKNYDIDQINDILLSATTNEDSVVAEVATLTIGERGDPRAIQPLLSLLPGSTGNLRYTIRNLLLNFDYNILDSIVQQNTLSESDRAFLKMLTTPAKLPLERIRELHDRWNSKIWADEQKEILEELGAMDYRYYPEAAIRMLVNGTRANSDIIKVDSRNRLHIIANPVTIQVLLDELDNNRLGTKNRERLYDILLNVVDPYTAQQLIKREIPSIQEKAFERFCNICESQDIPQLVQLYNDVDDPESCSTIIDALGGLDAVEPLINILKNDPDCINQKHAFLELSSIAEFEGKTHAGAINRAVAIRINQLLDALESNDQSELNEWFDSYDGFCTSIDSVSFIEGAGDIRTDGNIKHAFQRMSYIFEDDSKRDLRMGSASVFIKVLSHIYQADALPFFLKMLKDPEIDANAKTEILDTIVMNGEIESIETVLRLINKQMPALRTIDAEHYQNELEKSLFAARLLSEHGTHFNSRNAYRGLIDLIQWLSEVIDLEQLEKLPWHNPNVALQRLLELRDDLFRSGDIWYYIAEYNGNLLLHLMVTNYIEDHETFANFMTDSCFYKSPFCFNFNLKSLDESQTLQLERFLLSSYDKLNPYVKQSIFENSNVPALIKFLIKKLGYSNVEERSRIISELGYSGDEQAIPVLMERLFDEEAYKPDYFPYFDPCFHNPISAKSRDILIEFSNPLVATYLIEGLKDPRWYMRERCAYILGKRKSREALTPLLDAIRSDDDWCVRRTSAQALGEICDCKDSEALTILHTVLSSDSISDVRICAEWSLKRIYAKKNTGTPDIYVNDLSGIDEIEPETLENNLQDPLFDRIVAAIEMFEPACQWKREREYQIDLAGYLKRQFPDLELYVEPQRGASRPDLAINDVAIEVKGPTTSQDLSTIPEKIARYSNYYQSLVFVLFEPMYSEQRCHEILSWAENSAGLTCKFIQK